MMKTILKYLFIFMLIYACQSGKVDISDLSSRSKFILEEIGEKRFYFDSLNPVRLSQNIQCFSQNGTEYFATLYTRKSKLYIFNYKSGHIAEILSYDSIDNYNLSCVDGFFIKNLDSIFLFSNCKGNEKIYLINFYTKKVGKIFEVQTEYSKCKYPPRIQVNSTTPLILHNDNLFLGGFILGEYIDEEPGDRPVGLKIDVNTFERNYFMNYPDKYLDHNYGGYLYRYVNYCYNKEDNLAVYSFPADKDVFAFDLTKNRELKFEKEIIEQEITYLKKDKLDPKKIPKSEQIRHYYENISYGPIYYDNLNQVYYRSFLKPLHFELGTNELFPEVEYEIYVIIMDKTFATKGVTKLDNCSMKIAFVSSAGLNCFNNTDPETNSLIYKVYKLSRNEK